jgi:uncharacterized membrane protein
MKFTYKIAGTIGRSAVLVLGLVLAAVSASAQQFNFASINVPGAIFTSARGVNSTGKIVGTFIDGTGKVRGFLLTGFPGSNATYHIIDFPPSQSPTGTVQQTGSRGINGNGDIVGNVLDGNGKEHGFLLTGFPGDNALFSIIDFPQSQSPTGNVTLTFVHSINIYADVVGYYLDGSPTPFPAHGFRLTGFPGSPQFANIDFSGAAATEAFGINDDGAIVGAYAPAHGVSFTPDQAFLLEGDTFTTLTSPVGQNRAWGINNNRQIVGFFEGGGAGLFRGDLLIGSTFTVIMFPGSKSTANFGINQAGDIVGQHTSPDGKTHGFLATPTAP